LNDLQAGYFKPVHFGGDGGKLAVADAQRLLNVVVLVVLGIAGLIAG